MEKKDGRLPDEEIIKHISADQQRRGKGNIIIVTSYKQMQLGDLTVIGYNTDVHGHGLVVYDQSTGEIL